MKHSETYKLASAMNTEKQYSEYKIIDTTVTPVYEGAPVETHPEDQLEGGSPKPSKPAKVLVPKIEGTLYYACDILEEEGVVNVIAMDTTRVVLVNSNGVVQTLVALQNSDGQGIVNYLTSNGYEISLYEIVPTQVMINQPIPNVDEYVII